MGSRIANTHVGGSLYCQMLCIDAGFSGNAVLCPDSKYIFVTNLTDGVDQYTFPALERVGKFAHNIVHNYPLQVGTLQQAAFVVVGGDSGFARVFER